MNGDNDMANSKVKFGNIVLENNPRAIKFPALYCDATSPIVFDEHAGEWLLYGKGVYDFTTYFNCLSVRKLQRYCGAVAFSASFEAKGASFSIVRTKGTSFSEESESVDAPILNFEHCEEWAKVSFDVIAEDDAIISGFKVEADGPLYIRNGEYFVEINHELNDVELSLCTTTFKKESYITNNINLIRQHVIESGNEIADHFQMHVVDNGRTLNVDNLSHERITIHPNINAGGAGGFARGMIESMEQDVPATHVLLMDDDVEICPESIIRTFNLLRMVNEEHKDAFLSGAMLDYQLVEDQQEDIGSFAEGHCEAIKPPLRLTRFCDLVFNEDSKPTSKQCKALYAAWWYCCIPMETIRANGLPLPYFVRYDDVEYGIRCKPKHIMSMNGIGIWHLNFRSRYNAAVERYQTTRNGFIAQATTKLSTDKQVFEFMYEALELELKKYAYESAELILDGFEDYLKGPSFISARVAEDCFMRANKNVEKLTSFDQLSKNPLLKGIDFASLTRQVIDQDSPRSLSQRVSDYLSWSGHRFSPSTNKNVAIIPVFGGDYPAGKIHNKQVILVIDWYRKLGAVRQRDVKRFGEIMKRYKNDVKLYRSNNEQLKKEYAAARAGMTSVEFWKNYLGI